ncbi:hypothetical protein V8E36_003795 [Tilletia maclaganii]
MPGPRSYRSVAHSHGGGPPSPTLSATTRASIDFPSRPNVLVTRADLRASVSAFEGLLSAAKGYTNVMLTMAQASAELAGALETCARVKGAHESGASLHAASALHFLMSNYQQVLADGLWKDFSIPLLSHFDTYRSAVAERQVAHEQAVAERSKLLKETEARNMRTGRRKERDLSSFRRALAELQAQVDSLDELKAQYYHEVIESEEEVWEFILSKVTLMVRSQLEVSERIASKGSSDPVLEPMLASIPDPFDQYGPPKQDDQIFSILPPTSLLSSSTVLSSPGIGHGQGGPSNSHHHHQQQQQHAHHHSSSHQQAYGSLSQQQLLQHQQALERGAAGYGVTPSASSSTVAGESSSSGVLHSSRASPSPLAHAHQQQQQHLQYLASPSLGRSGDSESGTATVGSLLGLHSGGGGGGGGPGGGGSGLFGDDTADEDDVLLGGTGPQPQPNGRSSAQGTPTTSGARLKKALSIINEDVQPPSSTATAGSNEKKTHSRPSSIGVAQARRIQAQAAAEAAQAQVEGPPEEDPSETAVLRSSTPTRVGKQKASSSSSAGGAASGRSNDSEPAKAHSRASTLAEPPVGDETVDAKGSVYQHEAEVAHEEDDEEDEDERVAGSTTTSQGGARNGNAGEAGAEEEEDDETRSTEDAEDDRADTTEGESAATSASLQTHEKEPSAKSKAKAKAKTGPSEQDVDA